MLSRGRRRSARGTLIAEQRSRFRAPGARDRDCCERDDRAASLAAPGRRARPTHARRLHVVQRGRSAPPPEREPPANHVHQPGRPVARPRRRSRPAPRTRRRRNPARRPPRLLSSGAGAVPPRPRNQDRCAPSPPRDQQCEQRDDGGRRGEENRAERDARDHPARQVDGRMHDQRRDIGPGPARRGGRLRDARRSPRRRGVGVASASGAGPGRVVLGSEAGERERAKYQAEVAQGDVVVAGRVRRLTMMAPSQAATNVGAVAGFDRNAEPGGDLHHAK